jgi:hypothetical protein
MSPYNDITHIALCIHHILNAMYSLHCIFVSPLMMKCLLLIHCVLLLCYPAKYTSCTYPL